VASIAVGAALLPLAFGLRQTRDDWSCLRPDTLLLATIRGGSRHMGTVLALTALVAPAIIALWATVGAPLYLSLAVTGPLAVAPAFLAARLLGSSSTTDGTASRVPPSRSHDRRRGTDARLPRRAVRRSDPARGQSADTRRPKPRAR
ncbi:MAG: hypothetical protein ACO3UM_11310, partial [Planctomycetota bacterium]